MLTWLICPFVLGLLSSVNLMGMCSRAGSNLLDRKAVSRPLSALSGNWGGGEHDIIEALLELVASIVSKLGLEG